MMHGVSLQMDLHLFEKWVKRWKEIVEDGLSELQVVM